MGLYQISRYKYKQSRWDIKYLDININNLDGTKLIARNYYLPLFFL